VSLWWKRERSIEVDLYGYKNSYQLQIEMGENQSRNFKPILYLKLYTIIFSEGCLQKSKSNHDFETSLISKYQWK
jgi:hypothetical protein